MEGMNMIRFATKGIPIYIYIYIGGKLKFFYELIFPLWAFLIYIVLKNHKSMNWTTLVRQWTSSCECKALTYTQRGRPYPNKKPNRNSCEREIGEGNYEGNQCRKMLLHDTTSRMNVRYTNVNDILQKNPTELWR